MSIAADKSAAILVLNCIIFNIILHSLFSNFDFSPFDTIIMLVHELKYDAGTA